MSFATKVVSQLEAIVVSSRRLATVTDTVPATVTDTVPSCTLWRGNKSWFYGCWYGKHGNSGKMEFRVFIFILRELRKREYRCDSGKKDFREQTFSWLFIDWKFKMFSVV